MIAEKRREQIRSCLTRRRERFRAAGLCLWCGRNPAKGACNECRPTMGRPKDPLRRELREKYGLKYTHTRHFTGREIEQIFACPTEEARKLLLGIQEPL